MKKIYSLVLMAVILLVGTNAWAGNVTGNNRAALQAAINDAASGTTLTLQNDFTLDGPVWLGTADLDGENGAYKSIILDLNGHKISMATGGNNSYMFVLSHGELLVRNSNATQALIELTGTTGKNYGTQIFTVFGTYRSSRWNEAGTQADAQAINTRDQGWFSHLEIGQNVKIVSNSGILGTGIAVDVLYPNEAAYKKIKDLGNTINYRSDLFTGNFGLAQGVKVDIYGDIEFPGKGEAGSHKAYCVKVNGYTDVPYSKRAMNSAFTMAYATNYDKAAHTADTVDVPFIHIHRTAKLVSDNKSSRSTAVYSSGYSKMLIEGYCEGSIGVYASSGKVEINDAEVVSSSTTYSQPTANGGVSGAGSGLVVNSRDGYTGEIEVVISGDSKITATTGYAIEEVVTTAADTTKVESIKIEGGTIEGGNQGAIIVSDATADNKQYTEVVVYGANVTGNTQVGKTGDITDILPTDNNDTPTAHVTVVTDPETGKQTLVVSDGATPPAAQTEWTDIMALAAGADVNWTGTTAGVLGNGTDAASKVLGELQMISGTSANPQLLTVKNKATLTVDHLVMNKYAQIVVEAGGKFIVTGAQGIVAPSDHNIVLKASESQQAYFIFHPSVTSNRHPNATVEFSSKGYYVSNSDFANQRFGLPMFDGLDSITTKYNNADVATGFGAFDGNDWVVLGFINMTPALNLEDMAEPFTYYQMQHNAPEMGTMVRMYGKLYGNTSPELNIKASRWNAFANSFSAPIDGQTLINLIPNSVDKAFYLYDITKDQAIWKSYSLLNINLQGGIRPMQPFLIRNTKGAANVTVDYQQAVYNPAITAAAGAPARHRTLDDITKAELIVSGENGADYVLVAENDQFSAEFDNGYDAVKYMNDGINMYVSSNEKMSIFATDNLENTYVGFQAVKGGNYTIEFANVQGEDLILIDLETGARVAMVEGNTYEFTANEANDYRFQITKINKVATDIENTEAVKNVKGIYTITGQYVGEMNVWNTLPAGVYVVNGEKCVK